MESSALRPSLFANVPPFINFVPTLPSPGRRPPQRGPQYWDREGWDQAHLWRIPQAFRNWIEQSVKEAEAEIDYSFADAFAAIYDFDRRFGVALRKKKQRRSVHFQAIADPFEERADDCIEFLEDHPGVRLQMFPKMLELCSKDQLADNMRKMMERFPEDGFDFHPQTFILPRDREALGQAFGAPNQKAKLWMVKPPHHNNGRGVRVIVGDVFPLGLQKRGKRSIFLLGLCSHILL